MKKWIAILSGLLAVQLLLALAVNLAGEEYGAFEPKERLLAFDAEAVDGLRIEAAEDRILLRKRNGKWQLPESGDFPAEQSRVTRLLEKLSGLEKGWPVATTASALRRFKVADDAFERKVTLLSGERVQAILYVGTAPGFRKVHVRPEGGDAVYAIAFNSWEVNAGTDDWIDQAVLGLDEEEIERIEMPGYLLQREGESLQLAGLGEQETTNRQEVRSLVAKLSGLRIQSLLGTEGKPEYRQDQPELEIKLQRKGGEVLTYRFSKPDDAAYHVLKRSDFDHYFKVADFTVEPLVEATREKLVTVEVVQESRDGNAEMPAAEAIDAEEEDL